MTMQVQRVTAEAFEQFVMRPENSESHFELIAGEIVEVPSNPYSSQIAARLIFFIMSYLTQSEISGHVTGEQGGYMIGDERYAPDVAFVRRERQERLARQGFNPIAPDLAVEVISPTDAEPRLHIKIANYLAAGTTVWLIDPERREAEIFAPGQSVRIVPRDGALEGGEILPGFTLMLAELFDAEEV